MKAIRRDGNNPLFPIQQYLNSIYKLGGILDPQGTEANKINHNPCSYCLYSCGERQIKRKQDIQENTYILVNHKCAKKKKRKILCVQMYCTPPPRRLFQTG